MTINAPSVLCALGGELVVKGPDGGQSIAVLKSFKDCLFSPRSPSGSHGSLRFQARLKDQLVFFAVAGLDGKQWILLKVGLCPDERLICPGATHLRLASPFSLPCCLIYLNNNIDNNNRERAS